MLCAVWIQHNASLLARWRAYAIERRFYWSAMFEITWRRSARDSFLNAVSRLRNLATCASLSSLLLSVSAPGRFDGDGGAVGRRCDNEWRARKMAPTRVILMSCGSYNPPTNMHLRMFGMYISICRPPHPSGVIPIMRWILSCHVPLSLMMSHRCHAWNLFIIFCMIIQSSLHFC